MVVKKSATLFAILAAASLGACNGSDNEGAAQNDGASTSVSEDDSALASMNYREGAEDDFAAPEFMLLQVSLDSMGYSPGVIDGRMSMGTKNAIRAFQEAEGIEASGEYDEVTKEALSFRLESSATRIVTVPESWAEKSYKSLPEDAAAQAKLDRLGYGSIWERLAERFHTTEAVLYGLNPEMCASSDTAGGDEEANAVDADAEAGEGGDAQPARAAEGTTTAARPTDKQYRDLQECAFSGSLADKDIRVPNITDRPVGNDAMDDKAWHDTLASLGVAEDQPQAAKIVVDKSDHMLRAFDEDGKLLTAYTVTTGSSRDPLPIGEWKINGISKNPEFSYDPDLFWDVPDSQPDQMLPPGPNGPVGVSWIDLSKEHYGIHGTSAPETIGTAQSHGCVRLTNWDVAELSQMVSQNTKVIFQE